MLPEFKNEAFLDFTRPENRSAMEAALNTVAGRFGEHHDLLIDGERVKTDGMIASINPAQPDEVVGTVGKARAAHVEQAIEVATRTFDSWRRVRPEERARYLFKAAAIMRRRKLELAAWMVFEVGKSWAEADGDVAEAIDFLEFYGREMVRLSQSHPLTRIPGEDNELYYIPLGVGAIIPPWNFPLAILTGMTSAAIVAGNTVLLKPASESPIIGAKFVEIMEEAGLPPGVLNFVPGSGGEVGDLLSSHRGIRFVCFTGSKEVGLRINELASRTAPGQKWIKRVIAEMGGKDAILVDEGVDIADAAQGIVASAFGFQGQKCSACSRVVAHQALYGELLEAVVERTQKLTVGPTRDQANFMGPVINEKSFKNTLGYIEIGRKEGRIVAGGGALERPGYFIKPTIVADVPERARLACEEIFAPVVAFQKARTFEHGIELVNDTEFGLTGAVYSRNRAHLEYARSEFHVGNLYINRKCTGALVGVHPFGGFNMSGTDSKAGGSDYLLLFTQGKVVSERY
jgi:1-pyrroline-5-carboxylate dehydrogenase